MKRFIISLGILWGLAACQPPESKYHVLLEQNARDIIQIKTDLEAIYSQRNESLRIPLFANQPIQLKFKGNPVQTKIHIDVIDQQPVRAEILFLDANQQVIGTKYFFIQKNELICVEYYSVDRNNGYPEENMNGDFYYEHEKLILALNDYEQPIQNEQIDFENLEQWALIRNEISKGLAAQKNCVKF